MQTAEICEFLECLARVCLNFFEADPPVMGGLGGQMLSQFDIDESETQTVFQLTELGRGRITGGAKPHLAPPNAHGHDQGMPNHINNTCCWKKLKPPPSEESCPRFFPTPRRSELEPRQKPKTSWIISVTKNASKLSVRICAQVFEAIAFSIWCLHRIKKRRWPIPRRSESLQVVFMKTLQCFGFVVAIQALADLKPEKFQRASGRCSSGSMRSNDDDGSTLPTTLPDRPFEIHGIHAVRCDV
jgi:hypothetical protein